MVPLRILERRRMPTGRASAEKRTRKFVGALRLPGDETGDCFKFTQIVAS